MRLSWVFMLLPIIEIALFVIIGGEIGVLATFAWLFLAGFAGMALIRNQGARAAQDLQQSLQQMRGTGTPVAERSLLMIAGVLLVVPGFFTDFLAALLLIPFVRKQIVKQIAARTVVTGAGFGFGGAQDRYHDAGVIDGEYVIQDDPYVPPSDAGLPHPDAGGRGGNGSGPVKGNGNSGWTRH